MSFCDVDKYQSDKAPPTFSKHPINWEQSDLAWGLCTQMVAIIVQMCFREVGVFCVFPCVEGEVCETAGSAAQLPEDWPVHVPGTDHDICLFLSFLQMLFGLDPAWISHNILYYI